MTDEREFLMDSNEHGDIRVELRAVECDSNCARQGVEFIVVLMYKGENFKVWAMWKLGDALEIYEVIEKVFALLARSLTEG